MFGHLSNEDAAFLARSLASDGVEVFALAHLSQENNTPGSAYSAVKSALDGEGFTSCEVVVAECASTVCLPDGKRPGSKEKDLCLK